MDCLYLLEVLDKKCNCHRYFRSISKSYFTLLKRKGCKIEDYFYNSIHVFKVYRYA